MNHQYLDAKEERDPLHVYGAYIICECTLEYEDFRTCHWLLRARETANKLKNI
jgi:hypothetical protein